MPKSRILVIDDEAAIRDSLRMTLEYAGYEFIGAATGQEGLALAERESCELVTGDDKLTKNLKKHFPFIRALASFP